MVPGVAVPLNARDAIVVPEIDKDLRVMLISPFDGCANV
jgi:hypothetical protein